MGILNIISPAMPVWLAVVILLAAGWLLASLLQIAVAKTLKVFHFNQFCDRIGICGILRKGEVALSPCELIGRGLYWAILVGLLIEGARVLDIGPAVEVRRQAIAAIPTLATAILVLVVGMLVVAFAAGVVRTVSRNAGSPYAHLWSQIIRWIGIVLVIVLAVEQGGIRSSILTGVLYIVIAAVAFGLALAFGLGCKDMARNAMERMIADMKERHRGASKSDMEG